jgi:cytochrome c553
VVAFVLALAPAVASADAKAGEQKAQLCLLCHKPNNPAAYVPTLEGQPWQYLYNQIKAYREERRRGDIMQTNVRSLTEVDIRDLADFFAAQTPVRVSFALDPGTVARAVGHGRASCAAARATGRASRASRRFPVWPAWIPDTVSRRSWISSAGNGRTRR